MLTFARQIHSRLMTCCTMFASWTAASLGRSMSSADPDLSAGAPGAPADARPYDSTRLAKLEETLKRFEGHFDHHLRVLLDRYDIQADNSEVKWFKKTNSNNSLNYFAATESVILLKLAHSLSSIDDKDEQWWPRRYQISLLLFYFFFISFFYGYYSFASISMSKGFQGSITSLLCYRINGDIICIDNKCWIYMN